MMRIVGTLNTDAVEGGCVSLATDDGRRYEILWPPGWRFDRGVGSLSAPDGSRVAIVGDRLVVHGEIADDMVSICQVGPIFRATSVESALPDEVPRW
jgi:hypothetical protein